MGYTIRSWALMRVLANELPECGAHCVLWGPVTCFPEGSLFDFHTSPQSDPGLEGTWVCRTASTREWWKPFHGLRAPESDLSRPPAKPHPRLPPLESLTWEASKEVSVKRVLKRKTLGLWKPRKTEQFWILALTQPCLYLGAHGHSLYLAGKNIWLIQAAMFTSPERMSTVLRTSVRDANKPSSYLHILSLNKQYVRLSNLRVSPQALTVEHLKSL